MTGKEICDRAAECAGLKYWYGGKGELATYELAHRLQAENPSVWSDSYYRKACRDIDGHTHVGDCSYLVCHAYGIGMISSYGIEDKYPRWSGDPKDGMILWRKGHVGIYENDHVHELRGIDYDYQFSTYKPGNWSKILYDPNVDYEKPAYPIGWNRNMDTGQWWYQYGPRKEDYYRDRIVRINGAYYAFRDDGYMVEGEAKIYTDENGEIIGVD